MIRPVFLLTSAVLSLSPALAFAYDPLQPTGRSGGNPQYRTDYGERKLEAGVDTGFNAPLGAAVRSFDPFVTVTPYMDVSFGDGNSLDFQVTLGMNPMDPEHPEYYFFRSPVVDGTTAQGELRYAIPHLTFRYETDLTPKLGRRGRVFFWAGFGAGVGLVSSEASISGAGTAPATATTHEETLETFLALVPSGGFRFRISEFFFINTSIRYNLLMQFGTPETLQEGDLDGFQTFDTSLGISYEFGG